MNQLAHCCRFSFYRHSDGPVSFMCYSFPAFQDSNEFDIGIVADPFSSAHDITIEWLVSGWVLGMS